jgi:predicted RNA-binding Zn-ribbon protein involved in translation (DUF1610 family)
MQSEYHRMACPHCGHPAIVRSSEALSALTRRQTYWCTNIECGHTFVAHTEIVYTLSPSATPDPAVHLPLSKHVRRDLLEAELAHAPQADYQARHSTPYTPSLFQERQVSPRR